MTKVDGKGSSKSRKTGAGNLQVASQIVLRIGGRELVLHNIPVDAHGGDDALRLAAIESLGHFS